MIFVQVAKSAVKKSGATTLKSLRGILCFFIVRADPAPCTFFILFRPSVRKVSCRALPASEPFIARIALICLSTDGWQLKIDGRKSLGIGNIYNI